MKRIMIVGGHSGDEAIMAGPIAARVVREGGSAVFVAMTNGDGGHPTLGRQEYAAQKNREAEAAAAAIEHWNETRRYDPITARFFKRKILLDVCLR